MTEPAATPPVPVNVTFPPGYDAINSGADLKVDPAVTIPPTAPPPLPVAK